MSAQDPMGPGGPQDREPTEEEIRAALEEEMRRVTVDQVLLQSVVSLINLAGRRLGLAPGAEGEKDLDQVRTAIDAVRALLPLLEAKVGRAGRRARSATRSPSSRWPTPRRRAAAPAAAGSAAAPGDEPPKQEPPGPPKSERRASGCPASSPFRRGQSLHSRPLSGGLRRFRHVRAPSRAPKFGALFLRRNRPLQDFVTDHGVLIALVCAAAAVVYGVVTSRRLLALSPGNEEMQRISGAVQEGARAYLNRQYRTIADRRRRAVRRADLHPGHLRSPSASPSAACCPRPPATSA